MADDQIDMSGPQAARDALGTQAPSNVAFVMPTLQAPGSKRDVRREQLVDNKRTEQNLVSDQAKLPTVDVQSLVKQDLNAEIIGAGDEPGTVKIRIPKYNPIVGAASLLVPQFDEATMDVNKYLQDKYNTDPKNVKLQFNSSSSPVEDSPMGFIDRYKYAVAKSPSDKAKFLSEKYGTENVKYDPTKKAFLANVGGVWHNADKTGLSGLLGEEGDVTAGATIGAELGLMTGPAAPLAVPAMAAIGATVARLGTIKAAQDAGIRTEQDAADIGKELGWEAIKAATGTVAAPLAVLGAEAGVKVATAAIKKFGGEAAAAGTKRLIANAVASIGGSSTENVLQWFDAPVEVGAKMKKIIGWQNTKAQNPGIENPIKKEMADNVQNTIAKVKTSVQSGYNAGMAPVKEVMANTAVPEAHGALQEFNSVLKEAGLVDDAGALSKDADKKMRALGITDPESVSRIKQAHAIADRLVNGQQAASVGTKELNALGKSAPEGFNVNTAFNPAKSSNLPPPNATDVQKVIGSLDDIMEVAGHYGRGQAVADSAIAKISKLRADMQNSMVTALEQKSPAAAKQYRDLNEFYSSWREMHDSVAGKISDDKVSAFVKKLTGQEGDRQLGQMKQVFDKSGIDGNAFIKDLSTSKAALDTSGYFHKEGGGKLFKVAGEHLTPLTAHTWNVISKLGNTNKFVSEMAPALRTELFKNPAALQMLFNSTANAIGIEEHLPDALISQEQQRINQLSAPPPQGGQ